MSPLESPAAASERTLSRDLQNVVRLATGNLAAKAISLLAFVYLARVLGVERFGVLEFGGAVLAYLLLLADFGLQLWAIRETANTTDVAALTARVVPLRLVLAGGSFLLLLAALPFFPSDPGLRTVLVLYATTVFAQALTLDWVFIGRQDMTRAARGVVLGQCVFAVGSVALIHSPAAMVWVPLIRLCGDSTTAAYFARMFMRTYGRIPLRLRTQGLAAVMVPAFTIGLSQAMGLLNYNFDALMLGFLRGPLWVGWYNAAYKLILVAVAAPMFYYAGIFPAFSRAYAENREEFRGLVRRSGDLWLVFVIPLAVAGTFLAGPLIQLLYGHAYAPSAAPLRILIWSSALVAMRWVYMDALRATGHQALDLRCALLSATVNVGLNIALIPRFNMAGAAIATVCSDIVWFTMGYGFYRSKVTPGAPLPAWRGPLIGGAVMAVTLKYLPAVGWAGRGVIGVGLYLAVQAAIGEFSMRQLVRELRGGA